VSQGRVDGAACGARQRWSPCRELRPDGEFVNRFLAHLESRAFSSATVRAYAYDLLNFLRFLAGREARLANVVATDFV
jgi:site-specific recombinase XerD